MTTANRSRTRRVLPSTPHSFPPGASAASGAVHRELRLIHLDDQPAVHERAAADPRGALTARDEDLDGQVLSRPEQLDEVLSMWLLAELLVFVEDQPGVLWPRSQILTDDLGEHVDVGGGSGDRLEVRAEALVASRDDLRRRSRETER